MTTRARYWCSGNLQITLDGPEGRSSAIIEKPLARVGSHESSEIVLRDNRIPPRSLYLHATDRGVFCVNLSPSDLGKPSLRGWLHPEQILTLGPYRLSVRFEKEPLGTEDPGPDLETKGSAVAPFPVVAATVLGEEIGRRLLTRQLTVVGRHRSSKMQLTSHTVSAAHCVMYWCSGSLWVVDLLSGNGTRWEGRPIDVVELPLGCLLELGHVDLTYVALSNGQSAGLGESRPPLVGSNSPLDVSPVEPEVPTITPQEEDLPSPGAAWEQERRKHEDRFARRFEELGQHEAELAELRSQLDQEAAQLASQRQRLENDRTHWESKRDRTENEWNARWEQLGRQRADLESDRRRLEAELVEWRSERSTWAKTQQATEARLGDQAASLTRQENELRYQSGQWEARRKGNEEEFANLQSELEEEAARLVSDRRDFDIARASWAQKRAEMEKQLAEQFEQLASSRAELQSERETLKRSREEWIAQRNERHAEWEVRKAELEHLEATLLGKQQVGRQLQQQAEQRARGEAQRSETERELAQRLAQLQAREDKLRGEQEQWEADRRKRENQLTELRGQLEEDAARLVSERQGIEQQRASWEEARARTEKELREELARLESHRAELDSQRQAFTRQRDQWTSEQKEREAELDNSAAQLEARWQEFRSQKELWESQRKSQEEQLARQLARLDRRSTQPAPEPGAVQDGHPPIGEEAWRAENRPAGAPPTTSEDGSEASPIAELVDQDRVLGGLVSLAESRTRWGRIKGSFWRLLGKEERPCEGRPDH